MAKPWSFLAFLSWKTVSRGKVDTTVFSTSPNMLSVILSFVAALGNRQIIISIFTDKETEAQANEGTAISNTVSKLVTDSQSDPLPALEI